MSEHTMKKKNITQRIHEIIFSLLEKHQDGMRWSELLKKTREKDPSLHPKTVNGMVWKLLQKFPDKVYKPSRGVFRLKKYRE